TGNFTCRFIATDSKNSYHFDTLSVTISVRSANSNLPPSVSAGTYSANTTLKVKEGTIVSFKVNATDQNTNDTVVLKSLSPTPWSFGGTGSYDTTTGVFTYTPSFDIANGTLKEKKISDFVFKAVDNGNPPETSSITICIIVTDSNSLPKWQSDTINLAAVTEKEFSYDLSKVCTDNEHDSIFFSAATGTVTKGIWKWTPSKTTVSPMIYRMCATDNHIAGDSSICYLKITLSSTNHPPVAIDMKNLTSLEDQELSIDLDVADPDSTSLSVCATKPVHGTIKGNSQKITYIPDTNFFGPDSFYYNAYDGIDSSNNALVKIMVTPVNDAPFFASLQPQTISEGDTFTVIDLRKVLTDQDDPISSLDISVIPSQVFNTKIDTSLKVTITVVDSNWFGSDSLIFIANDSAGFNDSATIVLKVLPVNDPPSIVPGADLTAQEDAGPQKFEQWASIKSGPINESMQKVTVFIKVDKPSLFSVQPQIDSNGTLTFTVAADSTGKATVTVSAKDNGGVERSGTDSSAAAQFTITISNANDIPVIVSQKNTITIQEDATALISVSDLEIKDTDNPTGPFTLSVKPGTNYTVSGNSVTPLKDSSGTLLVQVTVSDGTNSSNPFSVTITITPVNDAPKVLGASKVLSTNEDQQLVLGASDFLIQDPDNTSGFTMTLTAVTSCTVAGSIVTPTANFNGAAKIAVRASDGYLVSPPCTVTVNVLAVNDPPVISGISNKSIAEGELCTFVVATTDPDGTSPTLSASGLPTGAAFNATTKTFSWTPGYTQGSATPYTITFIATDADAPAIFTTAEITITVANTDRAPRFTSVPAGESVAIGGTPLSSTITAVDEDGDPITFSLQSGPSRLTLTGSTVGWTPDRLTVSTGTYPVRVRATANGKSVDTTFNVSVTPHVWKKFSNLTIDYTDQSTFKTNITFSSASECYRAKANSNSTVPLEKLLIGSSNWITTPLTLPAYPRFMLVKNNILYASFYLIYFANTYSLTSNTLLTEYEKMPQSSDIAVRNNGDWFIASKISYQGGCNSEIAKNGIAIWHREPPSTIPCFGWHDIEVTPEGEIIYALSQVADTTFFHYSSTGNMENFIASRVRCAASIIAIDQNNGDTVYVCQPNTHILRTTTPLSSPTFENVTNATAVTPKHITMISGRAGWVISSTGIAHFTNNAFASAPTAEGTDDSGLIEQVFISTDGVAVFALGQADITGVKSLYRY
ncbi:MAG TPA: Ig-like domain-containing protein, partial [Chitinispirillaceae bacterium]|nr:Ig-like domain-containing protein [Chitinispirillaceae bacterium]